MDRASPRGDEQRATLVLLQQPGQPLGGRIVDRIGDKTGHVI